MKNLSIILLLMLLTYACRSQVQFNGVVSYLNGTGFYDNHTRIVGGGISGQYMLQEKFFIGATFRTYRPSTTAYPDYNSQDGANNFTGNVDWYFRKRQKVQPFVGVGAGVSQVTHMINYVRHNTRFSIYQLKAGLQVALGKSTGFFTSAQYNYTPGNGHPYVIDGIHNEVLTEPVSKFITLDAGLFIRLYMAK